MPCRRMPVWTAWAIAACLALGCRAASRTPASSPALVPPIAADALAPSNDRDWAPDMARLPAAEFVGQKVHVKNIRNCEYRSVDDFDVRWYDKTFDLEELKSVDFIMVPFAEGSGAAHTFLSFGFDDDEYLAMSVEIRREKGEVYEPLRGILNQYEIMYVLGDEKDLIGLRANHRRDDVYVHRVQTSPEKVRALFRDCMDRVNQLAEQPEFYNTLTNNCTTNIQRHVNAIATRKIPYNYQVLLPGYSDKLAYDLGLIDNSEPFERVRQKARINQLAYRHRDDPDFSRKIRR